MTDYYTILGVERDCTFHTIKRAYYRKVKQCHPDLFNNSPLKTEEFKQLVCAFDVLSDPEKRQVYNRKLDLSDTPGRLRDENIVVFSSIMDTPADDTLEELISGNTIPKDTSLATLMLDIVRTEVFITFREAKNYFFQKRYKASLVLLEQAVSMSPGNILYRVYFARNLAVFRKYGKAKKHYRAALKLGKRRIPAQRMERVRREMDIIRQRHYPLAYRLAALFSFSSSRNSIPYDQLLIKGVNSEMERLLRGNTVDSKPKLLK